MTIVLIVRPATNQVIDVIADDKINPELMRSVQNNEVGVVLLGPDVLQRIDAEQKRIGFLEDADAIEQMLNEREDLPPMEPPVRMWTPDAPTP